MRLQSVTRSTRPGKKLMATFVDRGGRLKTVHFGARGYGDYTLYHTVSPALARAKKSQYLARHGRQERWTDPTTPATLSRYILWDKPTVAASVAAFRRRFRV